MEKKIKNICDHFMISRIQRNKEKGLGLGTEGTMGYEKTGCYTCDGLDFDCEKYQAELKLRRSEVNERLIISHKYSV